MASCGGVSDRRWQLQVAKFGGVTHRPQFGLAKTRFGCIDRRQSGAAKSVVNLIAMGNAWRPAKGCVRDPGRTDIGQERLPVARSGVSVLSRERGRPRGQRKETVTKPALFSPSRVFASCQVTKPVVGKLKSGSAADSATKGSPVSCVMVRLEGSRGTDQARVHLPQLRMLRRWSPEKRRDRFCLNRRKSWRRIPGLTESRPFPRYRASPKSPMPLRTVQSVGPTARYGLHSQLIGHLLLPQQAPLSTTRRRPSIRYLAWSLPSKATQSLTAIPNQPLCWFSTEPPYCRMRGRPYLSYGNPPH